METTGEQNFIQSGVSQLIMHPEWNSNDNRYDADIAIAVLVRTLDFKTKFIKPICLWTRTSSYEDMIGNQLTVAGWGKTEFSSAFSSKPKWVKVPVVSESMCLRSNRELPAITSDRTFCAGDIANKVGACNGDSGKFKFS